MFIIKSLLLCVLFTIIFMFGVVIGVEQNYVDESQEEYVIELEAKLLSCQHKLSMYGE